VGHGASLPTYVHNTRGKARRWRLHHDDWVLESAIDRTSWRTLASGKSATKMYAQQVALTKGCPWRRASCDRLYPPTLCSRHIVPIFSQSPEPSCFDRRLVANCAYTHPIVQTQTQLARLFAISVLTKESCYQTYSSILWSMISPVVMYPTALVTPLAKGLRHGM
jgi:hypothetical protein